MNSNHGSKRGWERSRSSAPLLIGVYPVSAMAGFELSPAHRSGAPLAHQRWIYRFPDHRSKEEAEPEGPAS